MRKKTSPVWGISKIELEKIVKKNNSLSSILKYFKLNWTGGNHRTLKKRLEEEKINYDHIKMGINSNKGRKFLSNPTPLENIMVENSTYSRGHLKKRLLKCGILENKCSECGQIGIWNGKKLNMVLDHINGIPDDHRLENLRMLCPNCNAQQITFAGKKNKKKYYCKKCGEEVKDKNSNTCRTCSDINKRKVERPDKNKLIELIKSMPIVTIGRKYGVTDNAIRRWAVSYNINIKNIKTAG